MRAEWIVTLTPLRGGDRRRTLEECAGCGDAREPVSPDGVHRAIEEFCSFSGVVVSHTIAPAVLLFAIGVNPMSWFIVAVEYEL